MHKIPTSKEKPIALFSRVGEESVTKVFTFLNADGSPHEITAYDFRYILKTKAGNPLNIFELSVGNGLEVTGYDLNKLELTISAERATLRPMLYFGLLYAAGEDKTWLNVKHKFFDDEFDPGAETDNTITIFQNGDEITINITGSGNSGGLSTVVTDNITIEGDGSETFPVKIKTGYLGSAALVDVEAFDQSGAALLAENNAKSYADNLVVGLWDDRGNFNASVNAYPSSGGSGTAGSIRKGDIWTISVSGTLPTGQAVEVGDTVRALIDTPGNTQSNWSIQQNNIGYVPENQANKDDTSLDYSTTKYPTNRLVRAYFDNFSIGDLNFSKDVFVFTHFMGSAVEGGIGTNASGTGTAVSVNVTPDPGGKPGICTKRTGSTGLGYAYSVTNNIGILLGYGVFTLEGLCRIVNLSDGTDHFEWKFGLNDLYNAAGQDGVYFRYRHDENSGRIRCITVNNNTETITDLGASYAVVANTWMKLEIIVNAVGTSAEFYVNDVLVATHTANIPTGIGRQTGFCDGLRKIAGTNNRDSETDYIVMRYKLT